MARSAAIHLRATLAKVSNISRTVANVVSQIADELASI
jgi:hypothetical protein